MSYHEFLTELKLEQHIIAATRVNVPEDQLSSIPGCMAGCASLFRVPLGESRKENSRAVLGNMDLAERHLLDKNLILFTVSGKDFKQILQKRGPTSSKVIPRFSHKCSSKCSDYSAYIAPNIFRALSTRSFVGGSIPSNLYS